MLDIRNELLNLINEMDSNEKMYLWNEYTEAAGYYDDRIYSMEEFDEVMAGRDPWDIARTCFFGKEFSPCHSYFSFNGYANLESYDFIDGRYPNCPFSEDQIVDFIIENENYLYNEEIESFFENLEA